VVKVAAETVGEEWAAMVAEAKEREGLPVGAIPRLVAAGWVGADALRPGGSDLRYRPRPFHYLPLGYRYRRNLSPNHGVHPSDRKRLEHL
jgi:hypothetical protein